MVEHGQLKLKSADCHAGGEVVACTFKGGHDYPFARGVAGARWVH